MKKLLFGIFAHPDDEAFGPAGTLLREVKHGTELHLITLTAGQNGLNPDNLPDLSEVRLREWQNSCKMIGATSFHHLGYTDGKLDNQTLIDASAIIEKKVSQIVKSHAKAVEVEFVSMDTNGITGHIDHIVASRIAHQVFYRLKESDFSVGRLLLACIPREQTGDQPDTNFVFMEPGRLPDEIDKVIDNSEYYDEVVAIMKCHATQKTDCDYHLKKLGDKLAVDYFIVKN